MQFVTAALMPSLAIPPPRLHSPEALFPTNAQPVSVDEPEEKNPPPSSLEFPTNVQSISSALPFPARWIGSAR